MSILIYPAFKKYPHLKGNYGSSWWHQNKDFETFNGPILMTTNCIIPIKKSNTYKDRIFTTGVVSYPEVRHIEERKEGGEKDFAKRDPTSWLPRTVFRLPMQIFIRISFKAKP